MIPSTSSPLPNYYQGFGSPQFYYPVPMPMFSQTQGMGIPQPQPMTNVRMDKPFEDSLQAEQRRYESEKLMHRKQEGGISSKQNGELNNNNSNIFSVGNHKNNFSTRSVSELLAQREKKQQYAQMLEAQVQTKKDLNNEKKILETKHDLAMRVERSQNDLQLFNMPTRDPFGNITQSRRQPGNKNYQQQDWFTHLPNIDTKYISNEDALSQQLLVASQQQQQQSLQSRGTFNSRSNLFSSQFPNKPMTSATNNNNFNSNPSQQRSLMIRPPIPSNNHLSNFSQIELNEDIQEEQGGDGYDSIEDQKRVRILTPRKYRKKTIQTQTPNNLEELNTIFTASTQMPDENMSTMQFNGMQSQSMMQSPTPNMNNNSSLMFTGSVGSQSSLSRLGTSGGGMARVPTAGGVSGFPMKLTSYLKGEYKYANEADRMLKRNQYIELQNQQMAQMEEKKRQKLMMKVQEQRENELENLRIQRERLTIEDNEHRLSLSRKPQVRNNGKIIIDDIPPEAYSMSVKSKSKVRPRTPLEDATDALAGRGQSGKLQQQLILKEIPLKVKEQVTEVMKNEAFRLRNDARYTEGFVKEQLASLSEALARSNMEREITRENMARVGNEINVTRFVDEVRHRQLQEQWQAKEDESNRRQEIDLQSNLLANPGFAKYDLSNRQKVFFQYDDAFSNNPDRVNLDIQSILREGELPWTKSTVSYGATARTLPPNMDQKYAGHRNPISLIKFDEDFEPSTKEIIADQKNLIDSRLYSLGFRNEDDGAANLFNKNVHLAEINRPMMGVVDDIHGDLIRGNIEGSNLLQPIKLKN